ncbi:MAG TPA: DUF5715 family protein [Candidatus Sulfotelmatobacter sp.]
MAYNYRSHATADAGLDFAVTPLKRQIVILSSLLLSWSCLCSPASAATRISSHRLVRRHRLHWTILWNPMFRPSHESLLLQNAEINRLDLPRIKDDDELEALKESGALLPIMAGETLRFDPRLDPSRRYCRPWTRDFVQDLSQAYYHRFHEQVQVNSAVRTVKVQKKLRRHNRNAAPIDGETASSHLAGLTVDLQRRGMTKEQIRWTERYLFYMKALGLVEPEEERHQWVFHIMVSGRYAGWRESQTAVPMERPEITAPANQIADSTAE